MRRFAAHSLICVSLMASSLIGMSFTLIARLDYSKPRAIKGFWLSYISRDQLATQFNSAFCLRIKMKVLIYESREGVNHLKANSNATKFSFSFPCCFLSLTTLFNSERLHESN